MAASQKAVDRMTTAVPVVKKGQSIGSVKKMLSKKNRHFKTIDYIYVLDENRVLCGVVTIKDLMGVGDKNKKIESIAKEKIVAVHPRAHQENVVYTALSRGLSSVPVVDREGRLLGAVPYDEILKIFNNEIREDVLKFGGVFHKVGREFTTTTSPAMFMIKARLPWLLLGILGGTVAALVMSSFEGLMMNFIALASFIPLLVYMSDAAGTQSEAIIVRSMAAEPKFPILSYLARELKIALALGAVCGALVGIVAAVGWGNPVLGTIVGISMAASIFAGVCISTLFPLIFRKFGFDPAVATGPFATILSDVATLIIYFTVATSMFVGFGGRG